MLSDQAYKLFAVSANRDFCSWLKNMRKKSKFFSATQFAFSGREALDRFEEFQPDIMIIDMILPVVDGLGVLEQIRERGTKR